jgi:RNA polymerase subunit RPABC4/transcription elongation factor Spt4
MTLKHETSTRFIDEVRIIPRWVYGIALLGYALPVAAMVFALRTDKTGDPFYRLPVLLPLVILAGTILACFILLIGYINRDARRRGMSPVAWTLIAIFIPHALGIVLYFVLRKPRIEHCPQCGASVEPGFGFCPQCQRRLNAICSQCKRSVNAADKFCPHCGGEVAASVNPASAAKEENHGPQL